MFTIDDLWKIFNVIKGDDVTDITEVIKALAQSEKGKTEEFFTNTIDQFVFDSDDYRRFKGFLVNWYAALKTITSLQSKVSDPYSLPNAHLDEIFRSFGYNYSNQIISLPGANYSVNESKVNLLLDLVNLYKIKGTPRSIVEILSYYGLLDIDLFEFWVEKQTESTVIFKGVPIITEALNVDNYIVDFNAMIANDPHWQLTHEQVLQLHAANKINLPSKSPYFAIQPRYNMSEINLSISIIARKIRDEYDEYQSTGSISDNTAQITSYGGGLSLLELYLATTYIFNKLYSTGATSSNLITCYDGTSSSYTAITSIYDNLTSTPPTTRSDRESKLDQYFDLFTRTKVGDFLIDSSSAGTILNIINPDLYSYLNSTYIGGGDQDLISSLLVDLGDWIRNNINISYVNIAYIILGLVSLLDDIGDIIDFFKPYRARMRDLELLNFNNPLLDSVRIDDNGYVDSITHTVADYITADGGLLDSTSVGFCCPTECPDSTTGETCWGYRRDYYDCGSYYDIGCAWDIDYIDINDDYYDSVFCLVSDGTANIDFGYTFISDSTSGLDSTAISHIWIDSGFEDFDGDGMYDCIHGADTCQITIHYD